MPASLDRAEIWTTLACATGSRVAVLPTLACVTTEAIEGKTATQRLTVTVPRDATAAIAELTPRRVIRLLFSDGAFEEYRIQDVVDSAQATGVQVKANGVLFDLSLGDKLLTQTTSPQVSTSYTKVDTATNLVTHALTFAPSYFSAGTVTPTATASVAFDSDTPLSALTKIADAMAAATGTTYELSARRNGTTGYYLDLTVLNSGATVPDIRTGKNLVSLRRTRSSRDQATRVYPVTSGGDGAAWFKVTAVSTNTHIEIDNIDGSTVNPIIEDDCLNNLYWIHEDGVAHQITDTVRSSKRLLMSSTTGIAVGEWGYLALNSSKDVLRYVDYPSAQTTSGVQSLKLNTSLSGLTNHFVNGDFANWSGGTVVGWTGSGYSQDTSRYLTGGASAKFGGGTADLQSPSRVVIVPAGWSVTYAATVIIDTFSAQNYLQYTDFNAGTSVTVALDGTVAPFSETGKWIEWSVSLVSSTSTARQLLLYFYRNGGAFAVDNARVIIAPTADSTFVKDSGGAQAWNKGVSYLQQNSTPPVTYDLSFLDLSRLDSGTWPYDALVLGGTVNVADSDLGLTASVRATQIERNHLKPLDTRVTLATRPAELTSLLVTE